MKWLALLGASPAVLSSAALYINCGLWVVLGGLGKPFRANPYLNPFVFGFNLNSVLNDVGMILFGLRDNQEGHVRNNSCALYDCFCPQNWAGVGVACVG
jgi:hypothetical protein